MNQKIKKTILKIAHPIIPHLYCRKSYSQAGEDVVIDYLLQSTYINKPTYLDVGSNHPVLGNNTYFFYKKGGKGVLVEPDETIIPLIRKIRPRDKFLNIGVGLSNQKESDFYIFEISGLSTFSKEEAVYRGTQGNYKIIKVSKVQLKLINEIIAENFDSFPDFLSIDIEGLDLAVLKTLDFIKYPIPIICAETCTYSENHIKPKDNTIVDFMISKGYFVYADTYVNTIFVNSKWFNSIRKT
jgi:FkbM family methyltransferase